MKKTIIPARRRNNVTSIKTARWAAYAAAGAATTFAGAHSVEADITYSGPIDRTFNNPAPGATFSFEHFALTGGVFLDFNIGTYFGGGVARFLVGPEMAGMSGVFPGAGTQVVGFQGGSLNLLYASRLDVGQNISALGFNNFPPNPNNPGHFSFAYLAANEGYPNSQWVGAGLVGFLGFEFDAGNGTQFGWARVRMESGPTDNNFTLIDYAFADPGENIATGQVPEPGSMGLLALGGAGLLAWRKRRKKEARKRESRIAQSAHPASLKSD